MLLLHARLQ